MFLLSRSYHTFIDFINQWTQTVSIRLLISAIIISISVRLLGLFKEATIAKFFGVSSASDIFFISIILATFFVEPIAGSISPALTATLRRIGDQAVRITKAWIVTIFLFISITVILCFSGVAFTIATNIPGAFYENFDVLKSQFGLIKILYPIGALSVVTVIAHAVLVSQGRFISLNLTPIFVAICVIIGCYTINTDLDTPKLLLLTSLGFFIEALFCLALIRNFLFVPLTTWPQHVRLTSINLFKRWPTLAFSSLILSVSMVVDQSMAILAGVGGPSLISYGSKVTMGLISLAAIFPTLVFPFIIDLAKKGEFIGLRKNFLVIQIVVIAGGMALAICLAGFSEFIIFLLFQQGKFTSENTLSVSAIQAIYFLHLPFYISLQFTVKVLYAIERTRIHLLINLTILILNVVLNYLFIKLYGVLGIALATLVTYSTVALTCIFLLCSKKVVLSKLTHS